MIPARDYIFLFQFLIKSDVKFYALIKAPASGARKWCCDNPSFVSEQEKEV